MGSSIRKIASEILMKVSVRPVISKSIWNGQTTAWNFILNWFYFALQYNTETYHPHNAHRHSNSPFLKIKTILAPRLKLWNKWAPLAELYPLIILKTSSLWAQFKVFLPKIRYEEMLRLQCHLLEASQSTKSSYCKRWLFNSDVSAFISASSSELALKVFLITKLNNQRVYREYIA